MSQVSSAFFPDGTPMDAWFSDLSTPPSGPAFSLTDAGILDDGQIHTAGIQALIDRIAAQGGGTLLVPRGTFRTGALFFRPGVHLCLAEGATLLGSDDISDYPVVDTRIEGESCRYFAALINAEGCSGFTVYGPGTIDGNGLRFWKAFWLRRSWNPQCTNKDEQRPRLVYVSGSSHVTFSGVRLQNAAFWTCHLYRCDHVRFLNCSMYSPYEPVKAPSTDAIDLDVCSDVLIHGCYMHVNDDAVVLKGGKGPWADTLPENGSNERIVVEDCHYGFCHGCLTLGSEAVHCRNVVVRRITVDDAFNMLWLKMRPDTPQHYEYITMEDVRGHVSNALTVLPWTQFFSLKDRKDIPLSYADHVTLRRCQVDCSVFIQVETNDSQYRLSGFSFEDLSIRAENQGNTDFLTEASCSGLDIRTEQAKAPQTP